MLTSMLLLATMAQASTVDLATHFKGLDGHCWQATFESGQKDTRCFHVATGNKLAINTHTFLNSDGSVDEEGVSVVTIDTVTGEIDSSYYHSAGLISYATQKRIGNEIIFYNLGSDVPVSRWVVSEDSYEWINSKNERQVYVKKADGKP
ncbi:hypothetical protein [Asticcacaulis benevestitus]|uniref:Uncharacterized protein n=1 Tax=Asticcacaulis benevestitus DSM 16100 = ATCC BAA-896 TaxID=1121022 RepID=V4Q2F7_9CAUL|nr:hypothetical protein [Asticcacaulis benevestitus]ESQ93874.1 hypothetical protein ABENE_04090 [Asticcacaulis benevestitus DSM 16100 = ATCC BAA-896]